MKPPKHSSATSTHYDDAALDYDTFNEQNSRIINQIIEQILQKHSVQTVLDLTCGTGSQCFWLHQKGFKVHGIDISPAMLGIAKSKAAAQNICIPFQLGDMRTSNIGVFDAVLTIFNAIGHITSADFKKTLHNIAENLRSGGLYIFDIFNLEYWLTDTHITNMTIDWIEKSKHRLTRKIQFSTLTQDGILTSHTTRFEQVDQRPAQVQQNQQTLQIYAIETIKKLLHYHGFTCLQEYDEYGNLFNAKKSKSMIIVAQKQ